MKTRAFSDKEPYKTSRSSTIAKTKSKPVKLNLKEKSKQTPLEIAVKTRAFSNKEPRTTSRSSTIKKIKSKPVNPNL